MSEAGQFGAPVFAGVRRGGSSGLKLLLVCAIALVMSVLALFVFLVLMDRTKRAEQVTGEISRLMGGPQTFLGPVLAVPYVAPVQADPVSVGGADADTPAPQAQAPRWERGVWYVFPVQGAADVDTKTEVRRRSLFKVPVYTADVKFDASFDLTDVAKSAPAGAQLDWSRAEILVGASDPRGARSDVVLTVAGQRHVLNPATLETEVGLTYPDDGAARRGPPGGGTIKLFGMPAAGLIGPDNKLEVSGALKFTGASRLAILAYGKSTRATVKGDWNHPSFGGGFLPLERSVAGHDPEGQGSGNAGKRLDKGFSATWTVPFVARGVPAQGGGDQLSRLGAVDLAVAFVEPANPYQSVSRSLKYAPLFLGLVFLAYFLFETTTGKRVHPAQYVLIGLAQTIFYLLLLSVSEHLGFDLGFLIAAGATVGLISAYAAWVFDRAQGFRALVGFTVLYGLIYVLMRLEDYALLVGALASFAAIAAVMYFTRRIDWYGGAQASTPVPPSEGAS